MKKFFKALLEFLQEQDGGMSSRRLIFIFGSAVAIPLSYLFAWFHHDLFDSIHSTNLWYLGALVGFTTVSKIGDKIMDSKKEGDDKSDS